MASKYTVIVAAAFLFLSGINFVSILYCNNNIFTSQTKESGRISCCCPCPKPVEVKTVYVQKPKYSLDRMLSNVMIWLNETSPATPSK